MPRYVWAYAARRSRPTPGSVKATVTHVESGTSSELEASYVVGCDGAHSLVRQVAGITRTESVPLGQNLSVSPYFPRAFEQLGIEPSANFTIFNGAMNTLFCPYQEDEWGYAIGPVPLDFDLSGLDLEQETRRRIGRRETLNCCGTRPTLFNSVSRIRTGPGGCLLPGTPPICSRPTLART